MGGAWRAAVQRFKWHATQGCGCGLQASVLLDLQTAARLPAVHRMRTWQCRVVECRGQWLLFMRRFMLQRPTALRVACNTWQWPYP